MAMNHAQFPPGLSMVEFMRQYGTEAKCYPVLYGRDGDLPDHREKCEKLLACAVERVHWTGKS